MIAASVLVAHLSAAALVRKVFFFTVPSRRMNA
jgi:hypothetical protein